MTTYLESVGSSLTKLDGLLMEHIWTANAVLMLVLLWLHFHYSKLHDIRHWLILWLLLFVAVLMAGVSAEGFLSEGLNREIEIGFAVGAVWVYAVLLYIVICNALLLGLAKKLTDWRGTKWVKELDYVYLSLGSAGVFGLINRLDVVSGRMSKVDIVAPLILASAVVVRFVKTRAEIGEWNKNATSSAALLRRMLGVPPRSAPARTSSESAPSSSPTVPSATPLSQSPSETGSACAADTRGAAGR